MIVDPIDGQTVTGCYVITDYNRSVITLVDRRFVDLFVGDVTPEYHSGAKNEIQCGGGIRFVNDARHFAMVQRDFPDVSSSSEKQRCVPFDRLAFGEVSRISHVAALAFAFETALVVYAELRTTTGYFALVDV